MTSDRPAYAAGPNAIIHRSGRRLTHAEAIAELAHFVALSKSLTACDACRDTAARMVEEITAAMAASFTKQKEDAA